MSRDMNDSELGEMNRNILSFMQNKVPFREQTHGWALGKLIMLDMTQTKMMYSHSISINGSVMEEIPTTEIQLRGSRRWLNVLIQAMKDNPEKTLELFPNIEGIWPILKRASIEWNPITFKTRPDVVTSQIVSAQFLELESLGMDYPDAVDLWMKYWLWSFNLPGVENFGNTLEKVVEEYPILDEVFTIWGEMGAITAILANPYNWMHYLIHENPMQQVERKKGKILVATSNKMTIAQARGLNPERSYTQCVGLLSQSNVPGYVTNASTGNIMLAAGQDYENRHIEFISTDMLECSAILLNAMLFTPQYIFPELRIWDHTPPALQLFQRGTPS